MNFGTENNNNIFVWTSGNYLLSYIMGVNHMAKGLWKKYYDFETDTYSPIFNDFWEAVIEAGAGDFDSNQVAKALEDGLTPQEAARLFLDEAGEDCEVEDFEDFMTHDHSMNW